MIPKQISGSTAKKICLATDLGECRVDNENRAFFRIFGKWT
jgi:hypothetical protein